MLASLLQSARCHVPLRALSTAHTFKYSSRVVTRFASTSTSTSTSAPSSKDATFAGQDSLPRLPIPPLQETLARYERSCEPLLANEEEREALRKAVEEFAGPVGQTLQSRLIERDRSLPQSESWLQQIWLDMAYLSWREPSAVNVNWYMVCNDPAFSSITAREIPQLVRAAALIHNFLIPYRMIKQQTIAREFARTTPLCMNQLRSIYATTRIPDPVCDRIVTYEDSRHVVVLCRNQYFSINVLDEQLNPLSEQEILQQLRWIEKNALPADRVPPIGLLTSENRTTWANARKALESDSQNAKVLDVIDRSLFFMCLDDAAPITTNDAARQFFHGGDGNNRWFDKTLSLIVTRNSKAGVNGEHTPQDAPAPARVCDIALGLETEEQYRKLLSVPEAAPSQFPQKLEFNDNNLDKSIYDTARKNARALIDSVQVGIREFNGFGSDAIKTQKASPDCFLQMALQLAYYRTHHRVCATYETASTRMFRNGRTETVRSCSTESRRFVECPPSDPAMRQQLLIEAMKSQTQYMIDASLGKGVDRHLLGLRYHMRSDEPVPALFSNPLFTRSMNFQLSTSNMSPGRFGRGGFAPVTNDGYGVCYIIQDARTIFNMSSRGPNVHIKRFGDALEEAMHEVLQVLQYRP